MKLVRRGVVVASLVAVGVAGGLVASRAGADESSLPEKRPADATFHYSTGGGMTGHHSSLDVSAKEGTYTTGADASTTIPFKPTPADLDALYDACRKNGLDTLSRESQPAQVYDKPTTEVRVTCGAIRASFSDGQNGLTEGGEARWRKITAPFDVIMQRLTASNERLVVIEVDDEIAKRAHRASVGDGRVSHPVVASHTAAYKDLASYPIVRGSFRGLPGRRRLSLELDGKYIGAADVDLGSSSGFRLSLKDGAVVATPFDASKSLVSLDAAACQAHGLPLKSLFYDRGELGLTEVVSRKDSYTVSGPPGGPLGFSLKAYSGVAFEWEAFKTHALGTLTGQPVVPGKPDFMLLGEHRGMGYTAITGESLARSWNLVADFPREREGPSGVELGLTSGQVSGDAPSPQEILEMDRFGDFLRSIRFEFE